MFEDTDVASETRAYIAGYFDGEGSVGTVRQRGTNGTPTARILISQRQREPLERICDDLGMGTIYRVSATETHVLQLCDAASVVRFVRLVYPFARQKRKQLRIAYRIALLTRYRPGGTPVATFIRDRRVALADELFAANLLGKSVSRQNSLVGIRRVAA